MFNDLIENKLLANCAPLVAYMDGADKSGDEAERRGHVKGLLKGKEEKKNKGEETAFLYSGESGDERVRACDAQRR